MFIVPQSVPIPLLGDHVDHVPPSCAPSFIKISSLHINGRLCPLLRTMFIVPHSEPLPLLGTMLIRYPHSEPLPLLKYLHYILMVDVYTVII